MSLNKTWEEQVPQPEEKEEKEEKELLRMSMARCFAHLDRVIRSKEMKGPLHKEEVTPEEIEVQLVSYWMSLADVSKSYGDEDYSLANLLGLLALAKVIQHGGVFFPNHHDWKMRKPFFLRYEKNSLKPGDLDAGKSPDFRDILSLIHAPSPQNIFVKKLLKELKGSNDKVPKHNVPVLLLKPKVVEVLKSFLHVRYIEGVSHQRKKFKNIRLNSENEKNEKIDTADSECMYALLVAQKANIDLRTIVAELTTEDLKRKPMEELLDFLEENAALVTSQQVEDKQKLLELSRAWKQRVKARNS